MNGKFKKILVTGADGFIGSHLTEALVRSGHDVRAFVFFNPSNSCGWLDYCSSDVKNHFEVFAGDIRDPYGVKAAMRGCSVVLHLAALASVPDSYLLPDSYIDTNIKGTLNIVQAARELGVDRVVHTSTSEVYGTAQFVPMTEDHPLQGQSPYSASKIGADQIALSFYRSFDTPIIVLRPFNTYGPRQSIRAVIPAIITQIVAGDSILRLGTLSPTRDFVFVEDTVYGFILAMSGDIMAGSVINIGSGFEVSIGEVVCAIARLMGVQVEVECEALRLRPEKSEVNRLLSSNEKAKKLLGWQPQYEGLEGFEQGLAETIDWFKDPKNFAHYTRAGFKTVVK